MRRVNVREEKRKLKNHVLINLCSIISVEEMKEILNDSKKDLKRKKRVNKIMIGQTEVMKETKKVLREVLI